MAISLKLANVEPGMNVLDIGSGRGEIVLHCALGDAKSIGIDYSADAIRLASGLKNRYKIAGNNMSFIRGSASKLSFKNNIFDRVFLLDLVEHLHEQ
jgi:ubiquinone/menaquinone biosynthesis C-methylase UbiE